MILRFFYPPFGEIKEDEWKAYEKGYGELPERKRILLYAVMQRLCTAMGVYMEPYMQQNEEWRANCLKDVEEFLNEIESKG